MHEFKMPLRKAYELAGGKVLYLTIGQQVTFEGEIRTVVGFPKPDDLVELNGPANVGSYNCKPVESITPCS